jgi:hypothetical protein
MVWLNVGLVRLVVIGGLDDWIGSNWLDLRSIGQR